MNRSDFCFRSWVWGSDLGTWRGRTDDSDLRSIAHYLFSFWTVPLSTTGLHNFFCWWACTTSWQRIWKAEHITMGKVISIYLWSFQNKDLCLSPWLLFDFEFGLCQYFWHGRLLRCYQKIAETMLQQVLAKCEEIAFFKNGVYQPFVLGFFQKSTLEIVNVSVTSL